MSNANDEMVTKTQEELNQLFAERAERAARNTTKHIEDSLGMPVSDAIKRLAQLADYNNLADSVSKLKAQVAQYETKEAEATYLATAKKLITEKFTGTNAVTDEAGKPIVFKTDALDLVISQLKGNNIPVTGIEEGLKTIASKYKVLLEEAQPSTSKGANDGIKTPVRPSVGTNTKKPGHVLNSSF